MVFARLGRCWKDLLSAPYERAPVKQRQPSRRGKKVVTVYLPESVWRDAKMLAVRTDTTIAAIMRRGLDLVFAEHGINRGAWCT
jgi:hypothetical protein